MLTDIHCHLESVPFDRLNTFIAQNGRIGAVSMTEESAQQLIQLKLQYPDNIYLFLGIHPEKDCDEAEIQAVIDLIYSHRDLLSGIGEIGIPFFYLDDKTEPEKHLIKQQGSVLLERFIKIAAELSLPVNLHVVEDDIHYALPILQRYQIKGALFHWYEGSDENLDLLHQQGHFISVSPWIFVEPHYFEFAKKIPLDMLLVESDSPCKYNGKVGEPMMIHDVVAALAEHHQLAVAQLQQIIETNTRRYLQL
ncbi:TatD family hydrolase [Photobacterium lucens]|uniref:TatD family hydrolase n=1 Tax=Photobacterium lucens TaxID=2562949 RepID=UPI001367E0D8|nr:TatD family hydrolase [Photobacterium lucens]MBP2701859.1 translocase [Vibrio parahaemolyticus]MZG55556.1 translocase [Photobacterium lucens]MZG81883.1 translocase [Photobacterium lucens]